MRVRKNIIIAGIAVSTAWYLSTLPAKQKAAALIKRDWGNAMTAVTVASEAALVSANRNHKLPHNINELRLPKDCVGALYLLSSDLTAPRALIAYPVDGTPSHPNASSVYFFELQGLRQSGGVQAFVRGSITIASWHGFISLISKDRWTLDAVR